MCFSGVKREFQQYNGLLINALAKVDSSVELEQVAHPISLLVFDMDSSYFTVLGHILTESNTTSGFLTL